MMELDRTYVGHRETDAFDPKRTSKSKRALSTSLLGPIRSASRTSGHMQMDRRQFLAVLAAQRFSCR